ncbi:MAG: hypothetical protein RL238_1097 [Actinomycetota bacterium]|jgi:G3E family GTPase
MIDVVVVGGYLGAGKTTLVNHLLREGTGRRTLVLVNDFGKVAVADELVAARDGETITLTNGCVCCSLASPLVDALVELRGRADPPELLVIEASGVADPEPLSHHAMIPGFRLSGVVVVADAETVRARSAHELVGRTVLRQLRAAGLVVLNKTDLVDAATLTRLHAWLAEAAPTAVVLDAVQGAVPVSIVVGPVGAAEHHDHEPLANPHLSATWEPAGPVDRSALLAVLTDPSTGIVRAKGVVRFGDRPDRPEMVQVTGRRVECSPVDDELQAAAIVLIGLPPEFDGGALLTQLDATVS